MKKGNETASDREQSIASKIHELQNDESGPSYHAASGNRPNVRFNYNGDGSKYQTHYANQPQSSMITSIPIYEENLRSRGAPSFNGNQQDQTWNLTYPNDDNEQRVGITGNLENNDQRNSSSSKAVVVEQKGAVKRKQSCDWKKWLPWIIAGILAFLLLLLLLLLLFGVFDKNQQNEHRNTGARGGHGGHGGPYGYGVNGEDSTTSSVPVFYYPHAQIDCLDPQYANTDICCVESPPSSQKARPPVLVNPRPSGPVDDRIKRSYSPQTGSAPSVLSKEYKNQNLQDRRPFSRDTIEPYQVDPYGRRVSHLSQSNYIDSVPANQHKILSLRKHQS